MLKRYILLLSVIFLLVGCSSPRLIKTEINNKQSADTRSNYLVDKGKIVSGIIYPLDLSTPIDFDYPVGRELSILPLNKLIPALKGSKPIATPHEKRPYKIKGYLFLTYDKKETIKILFLEDANFITTITKNQKAQYFGLTPELKELLTDHNVGIALKKYIVIYKDRPYYETSLNEKVTFKEISQVGKTKNVMLYAKKIELQAPKYLYQKTQNNLFVSKYLYAGFNNLELDTPS